MIQVRLIKHIYGDDAEQIQRQVYQWVSLPKFPYPSLILQLNANSVEQIQLVGYAPVTAGGGEVEALCTPTQVEDYAVENAYQELLSKGWVDNAPTDAAINFQEIIESDITEDPDIL